MRAVIVSVRYADYLLHTLKSWRNFLPKDTLTVVTAPEDLETQRVARKYRVPVYLTKAWTEVDPTCHTGGKALFNKSLALDYALGLIGNKPPAEGELCVTLDADVVPFGTWPDESEFQAGVLYGVSRYKAENHNELINHRAGLLSLHTKARNMRNNHPSGYCQMFRYASGIRFGSYPSAGYYDRDFGKLFPAHVMRKDFYVVHMGVKGGYYNWQRRRVAPWNPPSRDRLRPPPAGSV